MSLSSVQYGMESPKKGVFHADVLPTLTAEVLRLEALHADSATAKA